MKSCNTNNQDIHYNKEKKVCEICNRECKGLRGYYSHKRWHNILKYKKFQEKYRARMKEENNPTWRGNQVKYQALHEWVRRHKQKPDKCEICGKKTSKLDIVNISEQYKRDINDYYFLCRSCHMKRHHFINPKERNISGQFSKIM